MVVGVGGSDSGLPTQTLTDTTQNRTDLQQNTNTGTSATQQMNQFTAGQQALQNYLPGFIGNILAGSGVSQNFGLPQSVWDAAHANFDTFQAPKLALQGSGSPAIGSAAQQMDLQLAGMSGQQAWGNALNAFSQGAQLAFKPIGQNQQQNSSAFGSQMGNTNQTTNQTSTNIDYGGLLGALAGLLPGGGYSPGGGFPSGGNGAGSGAPIFNVTP